MSKHIFQAARTDIWMWLALMFLLIVWILYITEIWIYPFGWLVLCVIIVARWLKWSRFR